RVLLAEVRQVRGVVVADARRVDADRVTRETSGPREELLALLRVAGSERGKLVFLEFRRIERALHQEIRDVADLLIVGPAEGRHLRLGTERATGRVLVRVARALD